MAFRGTSILYQNACVTPGCSAANLASWEADGASNTRLSATHGRDVDGGLAPAQHVAQSWLSQHVGQPTDRRCLSVSAVLPSKQTNKTYTLKAWIERIKILVVCFPLFTLSSASTPHWLKGMREGRAAQVQGLPSIPHRPCYIRTRRSLVRWHSCAGGASSSPLPLPTRCQQQQPLTAVPTRVSLPECPWLLPCAGVLRVHSCT